MSSNIRVFSGSLHRRPKHYNIQRQGSFLFIYISIEWTLHKNLIPFSSGNLRCTRGLPNSALDNDVVISKIVPSKWTRLRGKEVKCTLWVPDDDWSNHFLRMLFKPRFSLNTLIFLCSKCSTLNYFDAFLANGQLTLCSFSRSMFWIGLSSRRKCPLILCKNPIE